MIKIDNYHAHLYYPVEKLNEAKKVLEKVGNKFDYPIGRAWDKPVGPHPIGSCQITVPVGELDNFIPWMMDNRGEFDVFFHANTGDDLIDHTQFVMWLGKSYNLNLDMFKGR